MWILIGCNFLDMFIYHVHVNLLLSFLQKKTNENTVIFPLQVNLSCPFLLNLTKNRPAKCDVRLVGPFIGSNIFDTTENNKDSYLTMQLSLIELSLFLQNLQIEIQKRTTFVININAKSVKIFRKCLFLLIWNILK